MGWRGVESLTGLWWWCWKASGTVGTLWRDRKGGEAWGADWRRKSGGVLRNAEEPGWMEEGMGVKWRDKSSDRLQFLPMRGTSSPAGLKMWPSGAMSVTSLQTQWAFWWKSQRKYESGKSLNEWRVREKSLGSWTHGKYFFLLGGLLFFISTPAVLQQEEKRWEWESLANPGWSS